MHELLYLHGRQRRRATCRLSLESFRRAERFYSSQSMVKVHSQGSQTRFQPPPSLPAVNNLEKRIHVKYFVFILVDYSRRSIDNNS